MQETSTLKRALSTLRNLLHRLFFGTSRLQRNTFTFTLCAALLVFAQSAAAQLAGTASLQGTVTDPTGAVIPGATVTIVETATQLKQATTSGHDGLFSFPNIKIGTYNLNVTAAGFQSYTQQNIVLDVGSSIAINVKLPVGEATQQVEVQAEGVALQTETPSFKQTINEKTVLELPLNGREITNLITLAGATVPSTGVTEGNKGFFSSVSPNIAGGFGNQTDYRLDGGDNNDYMTNTSFALPFPDAVAQFSVETAAMGAESGLHPAGTVDVVTRSGTNQFHGSAFDFIRNNYIDATNYFATIPDQLHQNQFGGTFGGPILRNKLFGFAGYQRLESTQASNATTAFVPTAANLQGDFSATESAPCSSTAIQLLNPQTGAILPGNKINPNYFNSSALALVKYLPQPSDNCGTVHYSIPVDQYENQFITRIDANLSKNHTLYGRYFIDGYQTPAFFSPTNILVTNNPGNYERAQSLTIGENWIISNNKVNSIHLTATRRANTRGAAPNGINATALGINVYQPYSVDLRIQGGKFNTYCSTCAPGVFNVNSFSLIDDLNWVLGKHQLVLGGEFVRVQENINNAFSSNGNFSFNGSFSEKGPSGISPGGTGAEPLLDFLTGSMDQYSQSKAQQNALRAPLPSLYIQDTYHLNSKVVFTGGVRWSAEIWPTDYFGRGSAFSMSAFLNNQHSSVFPNAPAGSLFYGDAGVPKNFTSNRWGQFSPRVGITYDPVGDGKTIFRAGAGIIYDEMNFFAASEVNYNPPFATLVTNNPLGAPLNFTNPWSSGTTVGNPFPMPFIPPSNTVFPTQTQYIVFGPNFESPYVAQWTASLQHQFGAGWQMQLDYIGNKTTHEPYGFPLNPAVYIPGNWTGPGSCGPLTVSPGTGKPCSSTGNEPNRYNLVLQNPTQGVYYSGGGTGSSTIAMISGSNASYNGLVATIQHPASKYFTFLANYTWSHCISLVDSPGEFNSSAAENPNNIKADYGNCGFDIRNMFNLSLVAQSHFGIAGWERHVINGWELAPILRATSGTPFNVTSGIDNSLTGVGLDRPNVSSFNGIYTRVRPSPVTSLNKSWLNASNFSQNATGTFGNLGRNAFVGPNYVDLDTALTRNFALYERLNMQLRLESFNTLNHPNFNNPSTTTLNSSSFGKITTAQSPRIFQGAVKFVF